MLLQKILQSNKGETEVFKRKKSLISVSCAKRKYNLF